MILGPVSKLDRTLDTIAPTNISQLSKYDRRFPDYFFVAGLLGNGLGIMGCGTMPCGFAPAPFMAMPA